MHFYRKFANKQAIELSLLQRCTYCSFKHHVTILDFVIDFSLKGNHAPRFNFLLITFNFTILELSFYNTQHNMDPILRVTKKTNTNTPCSDKDNNGQGYT